MEGRRGYIGLRALLDVVGANDWTWRLEEFHGTTVPSAGVNSLELENRLDGGGSVSFTWEELLVFAEKVHQLIDGRISALMPGEAEPGTTWSSSATSGIRPRRCGPC